MVARRPPARVPVPPTRLVAGVGHRRAGPTARTAAARSAAPRAHCADRPPGSTSRRSRGRPMEVASPCAHNRRSTGSTRRRSRSWTSRPGSGRSSPAGQPRRRRGVDARRLAALRLGCRAAGSRSIRRTPDGRDRIVLTDGEREHGEPSGGYGYAPLPSPDGRRVVHIEVHDGLSDLIVRSLGDGSAPKRGAWSPAQDPARW